MKKRETITVNVHPAIAQRFRQVVEQYGGKMGLCMSAAMALFVRAESGERSEILQKLFTAQLEDNLDGLLQPSGKVIGPGRRKP